MQAKVAKWGNSVAVRLPKPLADELGLSPGRTVRLERRGTRLLIETITPPSVPSYRLDELLARIEPGDVPPLEDWSAIEVPWPNDDWSDIAPKDGETGMSRGKSGRRRS